MSSLQVPFRVEVCDISFNNCVSDERRARCARHRQAREGRRFNLVHVDLSERVSNFGQITESDRETHAHAQSALSL